MGSIGDRNKKKEEAAFTEKEIIEQLRFFMSQPRYKLDNLYVFGWESDCLLLTRSGYWYEFEVKISRSDFKNDFKNKREKHSILSSVSDTKKPNYFYYIVPEGLVEPNEVPEYAGLLYIKRGRGINNVKAAPVLHKTKNDPNSLNLTDKFYYNMVSAINTKNKALRELADYREPFKEGVQRGKHDTLYAAKYIHVLQCPYVKPNSVYDTLRMCSLKNRSCNMSCDYIESFEDKVENFLKHTLPK